MKQKTICCTYLIEGENVWLLHRTKHNWYELPGGKVDAGEVKDPVHPAIEELRSVALREMSEETTGYSHGPLTYIRKIQAIRNEDTFLTSHQFAAKITKGAVEILEKENFTGATLVPIMSMETLNLSPNISDDLRSLKEKLMAFARNS